MPCVFDTNVLVSALLLPDSLPRQALNRAIRRETLLLSYPVVEELTEVLTRKRFRRYVDEDDVRRFLNALTQVARWIEVDVQVDACRDPKDNKFLELAVRGNAEYLVSGDEDLLILDPFRGIRILSPSAFLNSTT